MTAEQGESRDGAGVAGSLHRLCRVAVRELSASGVGVSLRDAQDTGGVAAASDPVSWQLEELQFTLGEGPCLDAHSWRRPVMEADLGAASARRWTAYSTAAHDLGARAVFAFPLQVGAARLGALDVYRRIPGSLTPDALATALMFAEIAVEQILDAQGHAADGRAADGLAEALSYRHVVYQAQGMVMAQLGCGLVDAMARLRAHAYGNDLPLTEVAREVVAGRLRLEADSP